MYPQHHFIGTFRFRAALSVIMLLAEHERVLTSSEIATLVNANAVYIRKVNLALLKAGLIDSMEGNEGGYKLKGTPNEITLADIYIAMVEEENNGISRSCNWPDFTMHHWAQVIKKVEEDTTNCLQQFKITDMITENGDHAVIR